MHMEEYSLEFSQGTVSLNAEQYAVVTSPVSENQRILASAGSGKTTTITARIAYLIEEYGLSPEEFLLVSFSRAAAQEMIHRVHRLIGPVPMYAGTFHSLSHQILRENAPETLRDQPFMDELPYRLAAWLKTDAAQQWVKRIKCIIVDEFQDINAIQWEWLEGFRHPWATMTIVGDDAQNIYTWRGSSVNFILNFHEYLPHVKDYQLCRNYRSTEAVVTIANSVMRFIPTLPFKEKMIAVTRGGRKPEVHFFYRSSDECDWIIQSLDKFRIKYPALQMAVLSRYNSDLYKMEERLHLRGIRYQMHDVQDTKEEAPQAPAQITLATIHSSKGLEWDVVFFMNLHDEVFPSRKSDEEVICERRLFYVGVTRAKKALYFTYSRQEHSLSRFVREIPRPFLRFHNVASFKLSQSEALERRMTVEDMLCGLDGADWGHLRQNRHLPTLLHAATEAMYPFATFFSVPEWVHRLHVKETWMELLRWASLRECARYQKQLHQLLTPTVDRTLLTLRIYREDMEFWEQYTAELEHLIHRFLKHTPNLPPVDYGALQTYVTGTMTHLTWTPQELSHAAVILAKIRGQLRPLRHRGYDLREFSFGYVRHSVPTELRPDVLESWHAVQDPTQKTHEILPHLWRMAALSSVEHGRAIPLYQLTTLRAHLETEEHRAMIQVMETVLPVWMATQERPSFHVQMDPEIVHPIHFDILTDRCAYELFFDPAYVPTMEEKIRLLLKQYLYEEMHDRCLESIGFFNLATGMTLHYSVTPTIREQLSQLWQYLLQKYPGPVQTTAVDS